MADDLNPEERARVLIDEQLARAGWHVCDRDQRDLVNYRGNAVREVIMDAGHGRADYLLYVDRKIVGVIEAKPVGTPLTGVQWQSAMYAAGLPEDLKDFAGLREDRLPFVFEASGSETQFTNGFDPSPRARKIFNFPKPETLARIIRAAEADPDAPTWRAKVQQMPQFGHYELRAAQFDAVANIEKSLAAQTHSRSLVQMATGAGKTRMAVTESYRLIKYGGVDRVLFLVDRNNLADQTLREFRDYATPNDGRRFTDLYNVDKLTSAGMIGSSKVVISTIQRVFSVLRGNEVAEDDDPDVDEFTPDVPVEAEYSPSLPPEAFDLIIVDECHRSIYGVWRSVLEYFDAHIIGLTATPTKQTYGFFQQNLVSEYTYPESVADGVNVDFEVFRIKTKISQQGSTIEAGTTVPKQDRRTREQRLEELVEDFEYQASQLDRDVTSKAQIRRVLETFWDRLFTEIFPGPFRCSEDVDLRQGRQPRRRDRHHRPTGVRQGQRLRCQDHLQRQRPQRSAAEVPQLPNASHRCHGRHDRHRHRRETHRVRVLHARRQVTHLLRTDEGPRRTHDQRRRFPNHHSPTPKTKERFVIIDAVGVTEHPYVDAAPLNRNKSLTLTQLMERVATFTITADETATPRLPPLPPRTSTHHPRTRRTRKNSPGFRSPPSPKT